MNNQSKKPLIFLCISLVLIFTFMLLADGLQTSFGKVDIELVSIDAGALGAVTGKLYKPKTATSENPAPAVLLMHGYQNDKDTCSAYAIELARRGYVVLTVDEYGHGSTDAGMIERGYVNHKVTVNYGHESESEGTYTAISGPSRYKLMMNFSNMSFFNSYYSTDEAGNSIKDSSMGGKLAYGVLGGYDFVDETRMAVSGHSMGTWSSWSVAAAYSGAANKAGEDISPKAIVLQCGEIFTDTVYDAEKIKFNNVLMLQAKYEEFASFRDYNNIVEPDLPKSSLRSSFLGASSETADWNATFGGFSDGSARRMELLKTNHRLTTHNRHGIATAIDWINNATGHSPAINSYNQVCLIKEWLVFASMLLALAAMLALMELLIRIPFFSDVAQKLPDRPEKLKKGAGWWKGAIITILIAGLTYPFMTQLGHGLLPLPESIFRMTIGTGFLSWYLLLIVVMLLTTMFSWKKSKKKANALDYYDLGFAGADKPHNFGWGLLGKSILLTAILIAFVYLLVFICQSFFLLDLRFIWPFFKTFTGARFMQFWIYIPIFALFFILNNSKIFAQMRSLEANQSGFRGFISSWWRNAFCMAGGILLVVLIEYVPFFANLGPGADLLFSPTFGGPFMSLLLVFFPQIMVLSVLCTYIHRRTGHVFASGLTAAAISCWIVTGGSAML